LEELGYGVAPEKVEVEMREAGTDVLVADDAGAVVGLLAMHTRRHFQMAAPVSSIDALVVGASHRGQAVGTALVREALALSRSLGAALIDLNSSVARVEARRFYERLGFQVVSYHFGRNLSD
jgi:ribosomal protein S18 acetylase RimI-like enzyme